MRILRSVFLFAAMAFANRADDVDWRFGTPSIQHDQFHLTIDKPWVEERLKTPFERK